MLMKSIEMVMESIEKVIKSLKLAALCIVVILLVMLYNFNRYKLVKNVFIIIISSHS